MKPRLILLGEMGCGKSTLIRNALGPAADRAGGFVTLRRMQGCQLLGFDLCPATALAEDSGTGQRFLDFTGPVRRNDTVFSGLGVRLLEQAHSAPFAVADEFGGVELLIPEFRQALTDFFRSAVPCLGVLKTPAASAALAQRMALGQEYAAQFKALYAALQRDPNTLLLSTTGRYDAHAEAALAQWTQIYTKEVRTYVDSV